MVFRPVSIVVENAQLNTTAVETAIRDFCLGVRKRGLKNCWPLAIQLRPKLQSAFPWVTDICYIENVSDVIYVKSVIEFGINGLRNNSITFVYEKYFLGKRTVQIVAIDIKRSERTVRNIIKRLPTQVITQLEMKEEELKLSDPWLQAKAYSSTFRQRQERKIQAEFGITGSKRLAVLLVYTRLGRRATRSRVAMKLGVEDNTVKAHVSEILRQMGERNMRDAGKKTEFILRRENLANWIAVEHV